MQKSKQFIKKFKQLVEEIQIFSFQRSSLIFTSFPVILSTGSHPFPSRTRKLSLSAPMVLGGRPPGRVGCRRISQRKGASFGRRPSSSSAPCHAGGRSIDGHVLGSTLSSTAPRGRLPGQPPAEPRQRPWRRSGTRAGLGVALERGAHARRRQTRRPTLEHRAVSRRAAAPGQWSTGRPRAARWASRRRQGGTSTPLDRR